MTVIQWAAALIAHARRWRPVGLLLGPVALLSVVLVLPDAGAQSATKRTGSAP